MRAAFNKLVQRPQPALRACFDFYGYHNTAMLVHRVDLCIATPLLPYPEARGIVFLYKAHSIQMARGLFCISSINNRVFPGKFANRCLIFSASNMESTDLAVSNNCTIVPSRSRLTSKRKSKDFPKRRTKVDLPTCRAPLSTKGFRRGLSAHSCRYSSALRP